MESIEYMGSIEHYMPREERYIIENLFDFWSFVGTQTKTMLDTPSYKAIIPNDSDWPRRIFDFRSKTQPESRAFQHLALLIRQFKLPELLTLTESMSDRYKDCLAEAGFSSWRKQLGMIISLEGLSLPDTGEGCSFRIAQTAADADLFASIATRSFNYTFDARMIESILGMQSRIKLIIGTHTETPACCGLVFYDRNGYAGLHVIGTLPEFRGLGLASMITTKLLKECIMDGKSHCVLHASAAGEKVYTKLGFLPVREIITYRLELYPAG